MVSKQGGSVWTMREANSRLFATAATTERQLRCCWKSGTGGRVFVVEDEGLRGQIKKMNRCN